MYGTFTPSHGEAYTKTKITDKTEVCVLHGVTEEFFYGYCEGFAKSGAKKMEGFERSLHLYAAYCHDGLGIFLNYFSAVGELYIVYEQDCPYFSYNGASDKRTVSPQITQLYLEDFGMSYVIRLSDGRMVVIDGGRELEPDVDRLYACLTDGSVGKTPVIAMWILSHPHSDHFHCFIRFMEKYGDCVEIEGFMLNFPRSDDFEHYPKLESRDMRLHGTGKRFENTSPSVTVPIMEKLIAATNAPVYVAHTGQTYRIGDAVFEILSCIEDTIHLSQNINASSVVMRMELGGQITLWATDASCGIARLAEKHGEYLKADILQVPHHGFQSGDADSEIACYKLIRPDVCLLPVSDFNAYTAFCAHKKGTMFLMTQADISEMITGSAQRTITLPYTAPKSGKTELRMNYVNGQNSSGATTWLFSQLFTSKESDLVFTFLNATHADTTVWAELFFEDRSANLRWIRIDLPRLTTKTVNIVGGDVDGDAVYFNPMSLEINGIPENALFSVRFTSDVPIFVSHKERTATYHSTVNY